MPAGDEWKSINRRTALSHSIEMAKKYTEYGGPNPVTTDQIIQDAKEFSKFLNGEDK